MKVSITFVTIKVFIPTWSEAELNDLACKDHIKDIRETVAVDNFMSLFLDIEGSEDSCCFGEPRQERSDKV